MTPAVNIHGLDKVKLLHALCKNQVACPDYLKHAVPQITDAKIQSALVEDGGYVHFLGGKYIEANFSDTELDPTSYNKHAGNGAMETVVQALRNGQTRPESTAAAKKRAKSSSSSSLSSSLASILHHDFKPKDLILPFLTTKDCLRLSECCQDLLHYRYRLSSVKVVPHPSPGPVIKRGLNRLLLDQQGLAKLRVEHKSMLFVLDAISFGCFCGIKTLDLRLYQKEKKTLRYDMAEHVTRALAGGGLRCLEGLHIYSLGDKGITAVLHLLKGGACPQLRDLKLYFSHQLHANALVEALDSGHLSNLRELELMHDALTYSVNSYAESWGTMVASALQRRTCPELVFLCLELPFPQDTVALGEAMMSGACAKLEKLIFPTCDAFQDSTFIFGALEAGACPSLKKLDATESMMSTESATALGYALRSGNCRQLQELSVTMSFITCDLLQAIQQGGTPNLVSLDLGYNNMDETHGRILGEAIGGGALPKLETLDIGANQSPCIEPILAGLELGGCPHLKDLSTSTMRMNPEQQLAWCRALASGHLSHLQTLTLPGWVSNENMTEVVKALRGCHQLRDLYANNAGISGTTGQVLVDALLGKSWPYMRKLLTDADWNLVHGNGAVIEGLKEVLQKRRAELCPLLDAVGPFRKY